MEIKYIFDTYCGWCYGFDAIMIDWLEQSPKDIEIEMISGGLFTGDNTLKLSDFENNMRVANGQIAGLYGVEFGKGFEKALSKGSLVLDSSYPAAGIAYIKNFLSGKDLLNFIISLQRAFYIDGKDLRRPEVYIELADMHGLKGQIDVQKMINIINEHNLGDSDFKKTNELKVGGFPTLIARTTGDWFNLKANAYTASELVYNYNLLKEMDE